MDNIFVTADTGKKYSVKSVSFNITKGLGTVALAIYPGIFINWPASLTTNYAQQNFKTPNKIIPLYYTLGYYDSGTPTSFMFATPYFYASQYNPAGPNTIIPQCLGIMSKIIPYANQATNPVIGFQWNNIDWNETDFIDPNNGMQLVYDLQPENSLAFKPQILNLPGPTASITYGSTFLYLELQK